MGYQECTLIVLPNNLKRRPSADKKIWKIGKKKESHTPILALCNIT